jgi:hypothetical protein
MGHERIASAAADGLAKLLAVTDAHPGEGLGDAYLGRTTTDVLAHVHSWHTLFEGWIAVHLEGESVSYPAEGYSWKELDSLNEALYNAHAGRSYESVKDALLESHQLVLSLVAQIPESELVEVSRHEWLGDEALGDVAHECLGAHYEWALGILEAAGLR